MVTCYVYGNMKFLLCFYIEFDLIGIHFQLVKCSYKELYFKSKISAVCELSFVMTYSISDQHKIEHTCILNYLVLSI